ncbi:DUF1858 domain-containing protein [Tenuifilum thalassicum]|uniref:DUF1858 domain-containing protein n=1 Tax=Tenuifilum thalassicum TaxID=2590900 RepID=A0A7D3Y5B0_9BACT|nr:DUF1858 domain-containing protein [Tenuifilum thalassicum]QKG80489.1 DUF1858 domain-containing protein [Tenuifilum thalassicum]
MKITPEISIEELIEEMPESVKFLRDKGIICVICGEPVWGTLYDLASEKGFTDAEIDEIVNELNSL